jgi:hypothetical protein
MTLPEKVFLKRPHQEPTREENLRREPASRKNTSLHEVTSSHQDTSHQAASHQDASHQDTWVTNFIARLAGLVRQIGGKKPDRKK